MCKVLGMWKEEGALDRLRVSLLLRGRNKKVLQALYKVLWLFIILVIFIYIGY